MQEQLEPSSPVSDCFPSLSRKAKTLSLEDSSLSQKLLSLQQECSFHKMGHDATQSLLKQLKIENEELQVKYNETQKDLTETKSQLDATKKQLDKVNSFLAEKVVEQNTTLSLDLSTGINMASALNMPLNMSGMMDLDTNMQEHHQLQNRVDLSNIQQQQSVQQQTPSLSLQDSSLLQNSSLQPQSMMAQEPLIITQAIASASTIHSGTTPDQSAAIHFQQDLFANSIHNFNNSQGQLQGQLQQPDFGNPILSGMPTDFGLQNSQRVLQDIQSITSNTVHNPLQNQSPTSLQNQPVTLQSMQSQQNQSSTLQAMQNQNSLQSHQGMQSQQSLNNHQALMAMQSPQTFQTLQNQGMQPQQGLQGLQNQQASHLAMQNHQSLQSMQKGSALQAVHTQQSSLQAMQNQSPLQVLQNQQTIQAIQNQQASLSMSNQHAMQNPQSPLKGMQSQPMRNLQSPQSLQSQGLQQALQSSMQAQPIQIPSQQMQDVPSTQNQQHQVLKHHQEMQGIHQFDNNLMSSPSNSLQSQLSGVQSQPLLHGLGQSMQGIQHGGIQNQQNMNTVQMHSSIQTQQQQQLQQAFSIQNQNAMESIHNNAAQSITTEFSNGIPLSLVNAGNTAADFLTPQTDFLSPSSSDFLGSAGTADSATTLSFLPTKRQKSREEWLPEENSKLSEAVDLHSQNWDLIATIFPTRKIQELKDQWAAIQPKKGKWSKEEDDKLLTAFKLCSQEDLNDPGSANSSASAVFWYKIAGYIPGRSGRQCQTRYIETLDPSVKKGKWSVEEDQCLKEGCKNYGRSWVKVSSMVPGRTQRQCRTRWMQIYKDIEEAPVTGAGMIGVESVVKAEAATKSPQSEFDDDSDAYDTDLEL